jgi:hypothetical protein
VNDGENAVGDDVGDDGNEDDILAVASMMSLW